MKAKNWAMTIAGSGLAAWFIFVFMPEALPVKSSTVEHGDIIVTVQDDGKTRVKDLYVIYAPVAGQLLRIEKEVGDSVVGGETILATMRSSAPAFLDSRTIESTEASVKAATAAWKLEVSNAQRADAEVNFAKAEIDRIKPLFESGTVSQAFLDRAELQLQQAKSGVASNKAAVDVRLAELKKAEAMLSSPEQFNPGNGRDVLNVKSPVSGSVLALHHESAGFVSAGTPLMSVGNAAELEIVADFLSTSAVKVTRGAQVIIEGWGGEPLRGTVRVVEPFGFLKISALGIEEQRVNIIIDFDDPSAAFSKLGHGFKVEPKIVVNNQVDQIRVPIASLFRSNGDWAVFKVMDGSAVLTKVKIGDSNIDYAAVLDGLSVGDVIIQHPSDQVEHGVSVEVEK